MEIRSIWLKWYEETPLLSERRHDKSDRPVCLAVGVVGMSYGSLAMAYGFPLWVPFVLSLTVLAGASEFMFIGIVASGGNPLAAAAAGLLVNARHVPFGVTVRDTVGKRGLSFLGCHIMNDESVVFGLSQKPPSSVKRPTGCAARRGNYLAAGGGAGGDGRQAAARPGNHRAGRGVPGDPAGVSGAGI